MIEDGKKFNWDIQVLARHMREKLDEGSLLRHRCRHQYLSNWN